MRLLTLSIMTFVLITIAPERVLAQKYHSANDSDVEFSLEEKNQGPRPYYIDKEAIEKARKAQYANEKKEAKWLAQRLSKFLQKYREQKVAEQNRAMVERTALAQQAMQNISGNAKEFLSAHAKQARALMARQNVPPQGVEVSRALASLEQPVFKVFKHRPTRPMALKLWGKMSKNLASKAHEMALKRRASTIGVMASHPSSLPLGLQSSPPLKIARRPASLSGESTTTVWKGIAKKLSGAINNLKSKLFNW